MAEEPDSKRRRLAVEAQRRYRARKKATSNMAQAAIPSTSTDPLYIDEDPLLIEEPQREPAPIQSPEHNCGPLNQICEYCGSKNFAEERPADKKFTSCCRKGKVKISPPRDHSGAILEFPMFLKSLMSDPLNPEYKNFRENIRQYNSSLSFASMGGKVVDVAGRGPYVFKVHGQVNVFTFLYVSSFFKVNFKVYHNTCHAQPATGQTRQYAQLYVIDSSEATEDRAQHPANKNCSRDLLDKLDRFFRAKNRLAQTYKMMRDVEAQANADLRPTIDAAPVVNLVFRRDRHSDERRYNAPTANEIAVVFVNEDGEPPFERDFRVYPKNPCNSQMQLIQLNILSPNIEPMTYPLLHPYGEPGWQPNWACEPHSGVNANRVRNNLTKLQYIAYHTAIRDTFNPKMSAGKLTQQWLVDSYLQVYSDKT